MVKVGFTGTQNGMTDWQKISFIDLVYAVVDEDDLVEFHHGDCFGADSEAHAIVKRLSNASIVIHPPINPSKRAFHTGHESRDPKPYLERNQDIVDETDVLYACPEGKTEKVRSGTWATIRRARKAGKQVFIVFPDGEIKIERNKK